MISTPKTGHLEITSTPLALATAVAFRIETAPIELSLDRRFVENCPMLEVHGDRFIFTDDHENRVVYRNKGMSCLDGFQRYSLVLKDVYDAETGTTNVFFEASKLMLGNMEIDLANATITIEDGSAEDEPKLTDSSLLPPIAFAVPLVDGAWETLESAILADIPFVETDAKNFVYVSQPFGWPMESVAAEPAVTDIDETACGCDVCSGVEADYARGMSESPKSGIRENQLIVSYPDRDNFVMQRRGLEVYLNASGELTFSYTEFGKKVTGGVAPGWHHYEFRPVETTLRSVAVEKTTDDSLFEKARPEPAFYGFNAEHLAAAVDFLSRKAA